MRAFIFLAAALLSIQSVYASEVDCFSKFFNRQELSVKLSAEILSETSLQNLVLKVSGGVAREGEIVNGRKWSGRKYKNMVVFDLEGPGVRGYGGWADESMSLMLPQGFSEMSAGQRFKAIVTESASDGGAYNEILCRIK